MTQPAPQGAQPPTSDPNAGQQQPAAQPPAPPAPVPTPPANAPAPNGQQEPADGTPLNLTKERFNEIITNRLNEARQSWEAQQATQQAERNKALAAALGITDPNATPDPAELLKQAQANADAAQQRADAADAKALALAAGVKPERVDLFLRLVDVTGTLKDVDRSKADGVTAALQSAVNGALTAAPEFKGAPALPSASGGDRQGVGTPSLDEQIAAATAKGDHRTAIALKRAKARQATGG